MSAVTIWADFLNGEGHVEVFVGELGAEPVFKSQLEKDGSTDFGVHVGECTETVLV